MDISRNWTDKNDRRFGAKMAETLGFFYRVGVGGSLE